MKVYLDLLKTIKEQGTFKQAAREGMPGTLSLFGYQFRHDLSEGFPLLTTKKLSFKTIVTELMWFLSGDTNIKYLVDNGCNIWCGDAYNYYLKQFGRNPDGTYDIEPMSFVQFVDRIKNPQGESRVESLNYKLGDCGAQYGWLMRNLRSIDSKGNEVEVDQIKDLIKGLKSNPVSRRHILSNWNIGTLDDMALHACHALVQFNCRPLTSLERQNLSGFMFFMEPSPEELDSMGIPRYKLDCQMYQRSADVFLGVPFNIASYALLTHILAGLTNMIPGEFIHTFGDVHIYENHMDQVDLQLTRDPMSLPTFELNMPSGREEFEHLILTGGLSPQTLVEGLKEYNSHPTIKGKLSTGLN